MAYQENIKPDIRSPNYNSRRSSYIKKLKSNEILQPEEETMRYCDIVCDADSNLCFVCVV